MPVKYFVSIITGRKDLLDEVVKRLCKYFGPFDFKSRWYSFAHTDFYRPEMGPDLKRIFISFEKPLPPERLAKSKETAGKIEDKFRRDGKRIFNLDPGYIDFCKVVLATGKFGCHRIAVSKGCYADLIMRYFKNNWIPMPWCYPDFASGMYNDALTEMRSIYKRQMSSA